MARLGYRFAHVFFGAKLIDGLIAMLLLSTISSRSIKSDVMKITEDLPMEEANPRVVQPYAVTSDVEKNLVFEEFSNIVLKLSEEAEGEMQADKPFTPGNGKERNRTRDGKSLNPVEDNPLHEM